MMNLENFDLAKPYATIELVGLGHRWDLHSWADFVGLTFAPEQDEVLLEWRVPSTEPNPWGSLGNHAKGCRLRFRRVHHLVFTGRDPAHPKTDASSISAIGKAIPDELEYRYKSNWQLGETFHLRFEFEDTRAIQVGAENVRLEAIE